MHIQRSLINVILLLIDGVCVSMLIVSAVGVGRTLLSLFGDQSRRWDLDREPEFEWGRDTLQVVGYLLLKSAYIVVSAVAVFVLTDTLLHTFHFLR